MTGVARVSTHCPYCLIPKKQHRPSNSKDNLIVIFLNAIDSLCTKAEASEGMNHPPISSEAASALERFICKVEESGKQALIVLTCNLSQSMTTEKASELFNEHSFSKWIKGRIASEEATDPLFASAQDKHILNQSLSEPDDPSLTVTGRQIQHWVRTHRIEEFVIFGKEHLERSPPFKRRAFTLNKDAVLHASLLTEASKAIGIVKPHCQTCTFNTETIKKIKKSILLFLSPKRLFLSKSSQEVFTERHQDLHIDPIWLERLSLMFDLFTIYQRPIYVILTSSSCPEIPVAEIIHCFQDTFLAPYLAGCTSPFADQDSARKLWMRIHKVTTALNIETNLIKDCTFIVQFLDDSFALSHPNHVTINLGEDRHCGFCYLNEIDTEELPKGSKGPILKEEKEEIKGPHKDDIEVTGRIFLDMRLIFLGIEGVLALKAKEDETRKFCLLDDDAVINLMQLIQRIHEAGLTVGIVLTSPLRARVPSTSIRNYMSKYPFSKYIIGRTVSHFFNDPEYQRLRETENLKHLIFPIASDTHQMQILHWQVHHGAVRKPYVSFTASPEKGDSEQCIYTWPLLDKSHIEQALLRLKI